MAPQALERMLSHPWPGNVRELENAIERAVVVCKSDTIETSHLPMAYHRTQLVSNGITLDEVECEHIRSTLTDTDWNISQAARLLNIDRVTLYRKIKKYKIKNP